MEKMNEDKNKTNNGGKSECDTITIPADIYNKYSDPALFVEEIANKFNEEINQISKKILKESITVKFKES